MANLNKEDNKQVIPLGHGDPSPFSCFRTTSIAKDAIIDAVKSTKFNSYCPASGFFLARRAIADYLNRDLPYQLSPDDIFVTMGCKQVIKVSLTALDGPAVNILLPRPSFPAYKAIAKANNIEVRYFEIEICMSLYV